MEISVALVKAKIIAAEKKIIAMVIDGLPSDNSRRACRRHRALSRICRTRRATIRDLELPIK